MEATYSSEKSVESCSFENWKVIFLCKYLPTLAQPQNLRISRPFVFSEL
jgi:hypothetical protein